MLETTCYILKNKEPVPCNDINVWQKLMDNTSARTVAFDIVGKFEILTTFIGVNIGTPEAPKFFKMSVVGGNEGDPPICSESWDRAAAKHKAMVKAALSLTKIAERGLTSYGSSFQFIEYEIFPNEIKFLLASEAAAIAAIKKKKNHWFREGKTLIFRYRKDSATDSS